MDLSALPCGDAPAALDFSHFPARFQAVVWRNWNLVAPEVLARVLHAAVADIRRTASELGLQDHPEDIPLWQSRGYLTIIRRNWELLDYEQLLELLQWTPEKLAFILKEEDFLFHKLGLCKPVCPKVRYRPLNDEEARRTAEIRRTVQREIASLPPREKPFHFLTQYGKIPAAHRGNDPADGLKMVYSYSALYGDPLEDDEIGSYPEGMLADYAACGVNAVWMQATLYTLVPWLGEDLAVSRHWQKRQRNLAKLIARGAKYGIKVILYLNEPRSMPADFFAAHPTWQGAPDADGKSFALCTSVPEVRQALSAGVERLFREVPGIGGVFTITMSENLTHCKSRNGHCPRCETRPAAELAVEVNNLISRAMHRAAPQAKMIAYAWAWNTWAPDVIRKLDGDITVMAVSETGVPTDCLGCKGEIADYSISRPGPGEQALGIWRESAARHLPVAAKVQFNCSWELAAVPYIPVPDLVEEHIANLKKAGVRDLMLCWTLGGYPGGNLELLRADKETLAEEKFGKEAAPAVLKAWRCFSEAFHDHFPFNMMATIYFAPHNFGPMTLLFAAPTRRHASMIGFPFDDLEGWRGAGNSVAASPLEHPYPPEIFEEAFRLLSEKWEKGVELLRSLKLSGQAANELADLLSVAETAGCHFRSAWCQIHWVLHRNDLATLGEERRLAQKMLRLMYRDSRLGFEASNHYFYTENDLLEKILNCDDLLNRLSSGAASRT